MWAVERRSSSWVLPAYEIYTLSTRPSIAPLGICCSLALLALLTLLALLALLALLLAMLALLALLALPRTRIARSPVFLLLCVVVSGNTQPKLAPGEPGRKKRDRGPGRV